MQEFKVGDIVLIIDDVYWDQEGSLGKILTVVRDGSFDILVNGRNLYYTEDEIVLATDLIKALG